MRRISVINQKGGVGKTTTTVNLGAALARRGHRVLLADLDPQAHLTLGLGVEPAENEVSMFEVLAESAAVSQAILPCGENLSVIPAHTDLVAAETRLLDVVGREVILRDAVASLDDDYDFFLVDCPPSLGVLTLNGLAAAQELLIPLQPHFLALQGLARLLDTVALVQARINPELRVEGVVLCLHEAGTRLAAEVIDDVLSFLAASRDQEVPWRNARLHDTFIRRNIKLAESPSQGQTIFDYAPKSNGAIDYEALAVELLGETTAASESAAPDQTAQPVAVETATPREVEPAAESDDVVAAVDTTVEPPELVAADTDPASPAQPSETTAANTSAEPVDAPVESPATDPESVSHVA